MIEFTCEKRSDKNILLLSLIYILILSFAAGYIIPANEIHAALPEPVNSQTSYIEWLNSTGRPAYSRYRGLPANYEIYRKYNLLSYGTYSDVTGNRYDTQTGQYEALGFSFDEYILYNSYFPEDFVSYSDPRTWNRINLGTDAAVSWMRLSLREKSHIKNAPMFYMGKSFNGINFSNLNLSESKCVVIAIPSMDLGFALHTNHLTSTGALRYATFHGNGIGDYIIDKSLKPKYEPADRIFVMEKDRNYIDITFTVEVSIDSYNGLATSEDIKGGKILFKTVENYTDGPGPWRMEKTIRYYRTNHTGEKITRQITEKAQAQIISETGDVKSEEMFYTFTVSEEPLYSNTFNAKMSMEGRISLFRGEDALLYSPLPYNEMRFICMEKVSLRIDFENSALPENVTFFPVGGSPDLIPVKVTSPGNGYAEYNYTMGIIQSTLDWENKRLRNPYYAYALMYINGNPKYLMLEGIEITGSIHDLIYINSKIRN